MCIVTVYLKWICNNHAVHTYPNVFLAENRTVLLFLVRNALSYLCISRVNCISVTFCIALLFLRNVRHDCRTDGQWVIHRLPWKLAACGLNARYHCPPAPTIRHDLIFFIFLFAYKSFQDFTLGIEPKFIFLYIGISIIFSDWMTEIIL